MLVTIFTSHTHSQSSSSGYASLALKQQITTTRDSSLIGSSSLMGGLAGGGGAGGAGGTSKTSKGYSDIYRMSNESGRGGGGGGGGPTDSCSFQSPAIVPSMKHSRAVHGGQAGSSTGKNPMMSGSSNLSTTWPRQNGCYGASQFAMAGTARQISADNTILTGKNTA